MHITGLTVCVDYADFLARGLPIWARTLEDLIVVTAARDQPTLDLCESLHVRTHCTDVFWEHGAAFNKGAAIAEAAELLDIPDWLLLFDADVSPPEDWRATIWPLVAPGNLYGCRRKYEDGRDVGDVDVAGFFFLAHASDEQVQRRPLVDTHWYHAGNYDSEFMFRWDKKNRVILPLTLTHFGDTWTNWFGRGRTEEMQRMYAERKRRKGRWDHERIDRTKGT